MTEPLRPDDEDVSASSIGVIVTQRSSSEIIFPSNARLLAPSYEVVNRILKRGRLPPS
jgi:hypothetical protein